MSPSEPIRDSVPAPGPPDVTPASADTDSEHCAHCGLPVPRGLVDPKRTEQFCCRGCAAVYSVIHGSGLDRFYKLRAGDPADPQSARTTDHQYGEFDDPAFAGRYCRFTEDNAVASVELYLEGVHCAACVWLVEKLPNVVQGVTAARLDIRRSRVQVSWQPGVVQLSQIARTLDSFGYPCHPARDHQTRGLQRAEDHRFLIRLAVAAACAGNVMTLAFALYGGVFTGIEAQYSVLFRVTSMVFGLIALLWPGGLFLRGAWAALRTRTAHLDLPIAVALCAGGVAGTVNVIRGAGEIYFDSLTMLVFLLLVGRWLQQRQQRWSADALEMLFALTPCAARRVTSAGVESIPVEAVHANDILEVRAGESVPADGVVVRGTSQIDQSLLTGESMPIAVGPDATVHAGTVNVSGRLHVRVMSIGSKTRVGKLMQLVEQASRSRAPIVQVADRIAGWFVVAVLGLAGATALLWWRVDPRAAVDHAVALLIVTCPCALGLATPLAIGVALGRAASRQILIKGGDALERLATRGRIVLDKTGTLTTGRIALVEWHGEPMVRSLVAELERHSAHPIADALVAGLTGPCAAGQPDDGAKHLGGADTTVDHFQETGGGITGTVAGHRLTVGTARFLAARGVAIDHRFAQLAAETATAGMTPVLVGDGLACVALAQLEDPLRADAQTSVRALRSSGWHISVLSGDHANAVARCGQRLNIPAEACIGNALPESKMDFVREAARQQAVIMVGDGVNDAAALSAATVGIAVHGGAEASLTAADVYLNRPGLTPIVELLHAARRTVKTIHYCLAVSLLYNGVTASLAIAGWISPLLAAILMPISSFTVVAMAFAAPTFRGLK